MTLQKASLSDLIDLQEICTKSYSLIFADHWTGNGLELYLEQQFGTPQLKQYLSDDGYEFFFIKEKGKNIGFLKVNYKSSHEFSEFDNCELEKLYILPEYIGKGIGKRAMVEIINRVREKGKALFFLCVVETNKNAIAFYEKLGFKFHSKTRLDIPYFKDELRGMILMDLKL